MTELSRIILNHAGMYSAWELKDVFKLIYQNEFGCGHLVTDYVKCGKMLTDEYERAGEASPCLFEPIGNNLCRINLAAAKTMGVSPEIITRLFFNSAKVQEGSADGFRAKVDELRYLCESRRLSFSAKAADDFLSEWEDKGYPLFSHSDTYKKNYNPSYRVILEKYKMFLPLAQQIWDKSKRQDIVVGIDGRCGAGKTTLSGILEEMLDCNVIHTDDFFLPLELRTKERLSQPGGNIHYERFCGEVIKGIAGKQQFDYHIFDCTTMSISAVKRVYPKTITIIEGSYSLHPLFQHLYDIRIFCDIEPVKQKERITKRNGEESYAVFETKWIPMEEQYFNSHNIRGACDFIFMSI